MNFIPSNYLALSAGIPSPKVGEIHLGPLTLRAYALAILLGIVIGAWLSSRRYQQRGGDENTVIDSLVLAVPLGIIGARIYHIFSSPDRYFGENGDLLAIFRIWEGGLGVWGAIPGGAIGAYLLLRRRGLRFSVYADALAPGILIAQAIGRIGNYFNQELFGGPTTLPWGLQIDHPPSQFPVGTLFHPTFLYELLWNLAMAALIIYVDRKLRLGYGRVFWLYVAAYTAGRGWIEGLRIDEAQIIAGLRLNVWVSILVFIFALAMFIIVGKRHPGREPSVWLPGREPEQTSDHDDPTTDTAEIAAEGGGAPSPEGAQEGEETHS